MTATAANGETGESGPSLVVSAIISVVELERLFPELLPPPPPPLELDPTIELVELQDEPLPEELEPMFPPPFELPPPPPPLVEELLPQDDPEEELLPTPRSCLRNLARLF